MWLVQLATGITPSSLPGGCLPNVGRRRQAAGGRPSGVESTSPWCVCKAKRNNIPHHNDRKSCGRERECGGRVSNFRQSSSWKLDAFASPVHRLANRHSSSRQTTVSSAFSSTFNFVMLLSKRILKRRMEIPDDLSTRLIRAFRRSTTQTVMHLPFWQICGPRSGASLVRCNADALQALSYPL